MKVKEMICEENTAAIFGFSNVYISNNNVFPNVKPCMHVNNIHIEKTMSRIFVLGPAWLTLLIKENSSISELRF